jgi:hypothetical protein
VSRQVNTRPVNVAVKCPEAPLGASCGRGISWATVSVPANRVTPDAVELVALADGETAPDDEPDPELEK